VGGGLTPRWRNTAQWARNSLREEGLIRDDSPRGIWEITDKGRQWLKAEERA
jgi:restriction system protein